MNDLQQEVQEAIDRLVESGAERGLQVDAVSGIADPRSGRPVTLIRSLAALRDWATSRGLEWDNRGDGKDEVWGGRFEFYLTDPAKQPDPEKWSIEITCLLRDDTAEGGTMRGRVANQRATSRAVWPSRHDGRSPGPDTYVSSSSPPSARQRSCGCTLWDPRRSTSSVAPSPPGAYLSPMATVNL